MNDAGRFYDPLNNKPEKIVISNKLKASVRSSHAAYKAKLKEEKLRQQKFRGRDQKMERGIKEVTTREGRNQKWPRKNNFFVRLKTALGQKKKKINMDIVVADELLDDATNKLQEVLSADEVSKRAVNVSYLMIDTAREETSICSC